MLDVESKLLSLADPAQAVNLARFFKTGPGGYGEGDRFLGVKVPRIRAVVREARGLSPAEAARLLASPWHEVRLAGLLVLVDDFAGVQKTGDVTVGHEIFEIYLKAAHDGRINNWDLVDLTAPQIVGGWLEHRDRAALSRLARSASIWERRIAVLACFTFIKAGETTTAFEILQQVEHDPHDLLQKAAGWMLREIGKRCGRQTLVDWLASDSHRYRRLPRTTLRYAIEHFPSEVRQRYLRGEI